MCIKLKEWKNEHPSDMWNLLSQITGISIGYLNQIAYGNRGLTIKKAECIANATQSISGVEILDKSELVFCRRR